MKNSIAREPQPTFRARLRDAARFWEPGRVAYNLVLSGVAIGWVLFTWPHFRPAWCLQALPPLLALAAMANVCYSAGYLADLLLQSSALQGLWQSRRRALWLAGTVFAVGLECYWIADEIYPNVG